MSYVAHKGRPGAQGLRDGRDPRVHPGLRDPRGRRGRKGKVVFRARQVRRGHQAPKAKHL